MESRGSTKLLAPGFRFHPTDEELVRYYLRRKICGRPLRIDAISEIDIYKVEPWDLPGMSRLNTRDLEWYFFSVLDKKYGNGGRTNRATEKGYWKTTGKDRAVHHKSQVVGMKKTLVYHSGRAPRGQRTNWVMHEYRLIDGELDRAEIPQDAFVLCRVFQKSGAGPKNGEQYGAPFIEEEWEDELQMLPKEQVAEEVEFGDDIYLDGNDLDQILGTDTAVDGVPLPFNYRYGENGSSEETNNSSEGAQNWLQQPDEQKPNDLAVQQNVDTSAVNHDHAGESSERANAEDVDYLLNEPLVNEADDLQFNSEAFLEVNDLSNPVEVDSFGFDVEEVLNFFDANDDFQNMGFDPSVLIGNDDQFSYQAPLAEKNTFEVSQQLLAPSEGLGEHKNDFASSSTNFVSDNQYPFMKQATQMLGNIHAPPAFASEFPTKDATHLVNSTSEPSSSMHVTTGLIQIRNMTVGGNGMDWPLGKHGGYNIFLSIGLSQGTDNSTSLESSFSIHPGKTASITSRGWFYHLFFWVLMLSISVRVGTLICAR